MTSAYRHISDSKSTSTPAGEKVFTVSEVAEIIGLSDQTVRARIHDGSIAAFRTSPNSKTSYWRITQSAITDYMNSQGNAMENSLSPARSSGG